MDCNDLYGWESGFVAENTRKHCWKCALAAHFFYQKEARMQIAKPEKTTGEYLMEIKMSFPMLYELSKTRENIEDEIFENLSESDRKKWEKLENIVMQYENLLIIGAVHEGRREMTRDIKELLQL